MRQLYVTDNHPTTPTLIGVLTEIKPGGKDPYGQRGEYTFEYKTDNPALRTAGFPDLSKVYTGSDMLDWLAKFLPAKNSEKFFNGLLESAELTEYDEWEWLKAFGKRNVNTDALLSDVIPTKGVA
jgi:hypothetical protein